MPQARRRALNEAVFREVNDRIAELTIAHHIEELELVCECSKLGCSEPIQIALGTYEPARRDPTVFIVAPGHTDRKIERVIEDHRRYLLVQKIGIAADEARATADGSA